jgi:hypothetical protein
VRHRELTNAKGVRQQLRVRWQANTHLKAYSQVHPIPPTWIGHAATVWSGPWGAVTAHTQPVGGSRPVAYTHAERVLTAVAETQTRGPSRTQLQTEGQPLREEHRQRWAALADTIPFGEAAERRFTGTAAALGLSLNQTHALLACVLPPIACPHRSTLGRWVDAAAAQASQVLAVLDTACRPRVRSLCLAEICCHRLPVLMGVEPHSLAWVLGQRGPDRSGASWHAALQSWRYLEYVTSDDGTGLQLGREAVRRDRQPAQDERPRAGALDVFHTRREGERALRREWSEAERVWEQAEQADRALAQTRRRGQDQRADQQRSLRAWQQAEAALATACRREAAWQRAVQALARVRRDGPLNDRGWAETEIQAALPDLEGPRWAKVRRMLADPRSLVFLDRLHPALVAAEPRAELRQALVAWWRIRHATRPGCGPRPGASRAAVAPYGRALVCGPLAPDWHGAYRRVARVLGQVVRASSVVECRNSVVRMHQARHRTLSQALLDLKRLDWNCREFAEGKREGECPYQHWGLGLPHDDWWELLSAAATELQAKVSTPQLAA